MSGLMKCKDPIELFNEFSWYIKQTLFWTI
jgi:hypothetical protein